MIRFMCTVVTMVLLLVGCEGYTTPTSTDGTGAALAPNLGGYALRNEDAMRPNGVFEPWGMNCPENASVTTLNDSTKVISLNVWCVTNRFDPRIKIDRHYNGGVTMVAAFAAAWGKKYSVRDTVVSHIGENVLYYTAVANAKCPDGQYRNSSVRTSIQLQIVRPF